MTDDAKTPARYWFGLVAGLGVFLGGAGSFVGRIIAAERAPTTAVPTLARATDRFWETTDAS